MQHAGRMFLLVALLGVCPLAAQHSIDVAKLDAYLSARASTGRWSGSVLVAVDDKVVLRKGYGLADVATGRPFTVETPTYVASISKMFVASLALLLARDGQLDLDAPVCRYLPSCPEAWGGVSVTQLIHHTSGIPDYEEALGLGSPAYLSFMTRPHASDSILAEARRKPLDFAPGTRMAYSNTGYVVLARVLERAGRAPLAEQVQRRLLQPAGMHQSVFLTPAGPPARTATGYTHGDLGWEKTLGGTRLTDGHLTPLPKLPLDDGAGEAGLVTTVEDLWRWVQALDGATVLRQDEVVRATSPGLDGYAFGWIVDSALGRLRWQHSGMLPGYVSWIARFPEERVTVILAGNMDRAPIQRMLRDLSAGALGMPYDLPVAGPVQTLSESQYQRLFGTYVLAPSGLDLTVSKDGELLTAKLTGRFTAGLIPLSPTEFYMPLADGRVTFRLGASGAAESVNLRFDGVDHIATRKSG